MTQAFKCPACGERTVVPIAYGMPGPEGVLEAQRGEVVLGGCLIWGEAPDVYRRECVYRW